MASHRFDVGYLDLDDTSLDNLHKYSEAYPTPWGSSDQMDYLDYAPMDNRYANKNISSRPQDLEISPSQFRDADIISRGSRAGGMRSHSNIESRDPLDKVKAATSSANLSRFSDNWQASCTSPKSQALETSTMASGTLFRETAEDFRVPESGKELHTCNICGVVKSNISAIRYTQAHVLAQFYQ